jgi:hypothetical protein
MQIEWRKSGPNTWTARSNAYTITRVNKNRYDVKDGHGRMVGPRHPSLKAAKAGAQAHQNERIR